ncbi:MAG: peptidoglycan editing factor PgeF [Desulfobacterales bacterium]|nr:peptidoglycan editing factor PgeF [Desulfobacterales bacterium]
MNLNLKKYKDVSFFEFTSLSKFPEITHALFTRLGGFSEPPYHTLNLSFGVGDNEINVKKNRDIVLESLSADNHISLKQVHGTEVVVIKEDSPIDLIEADAMITNVSGKFLLIKIADCQAIMIYDPVCKLIANIHSGWRGSIKNITQVTIEKMKTVFGCMPKNMFACVSPSLGPCCAEFINYEKEIPEEFWKYKVNKYNFDFWKITLDQLCTAGLYPENITLSKICTKCNTDLFFSYRGEKITGRFASLIGLKK